jgi:F-type H+-transporting ATPase subunit b
MDHVVFALAQGGSPLREVAQRFGVDWTHLFAQVVSFSIVCAVLAVFAYRPILAMLAARREQIAQGLANAEKIRHALAGIEIERRDVLAKADAEARQLVDDARAAAARVRAEETRRASEAAEQILVKARASADRERAAMLADLKHQVGRLVVETSAAVTGKILTPEDHRRLAEETARQLPA